MSDQQNATDTSAQKPQDQQQAKPTEQQAPPPAKDDKEPAWLPERLERERRALLKSLGVESEEDVKKALADFKAKLDAEKTEAQKNAERLSELDKIKARAGDLETTVKGRATREMAGLSDVQRAAVVAIAGEDPAAQLRAIDALAPTWEQSKTKTETQPKPEAKPPADTAPPRIAPKDDSQSSESPKDTYARLKKTNPVVAARYLSEHAHEIYPSS